ncbi:hypothetical protein ACQKFK_31290 [Bacillus mycoides]
MKVACTVRIGGKDGDNFKDLPIENTRSDVTEGNPQMGKYESE